MWLLAESSKLYMWLTQVAHISFGQHRFRYPEVVTQPMGIRKGFLEERTPKPSWVKGEVMGRKGFQGMRAAVHLALDPEDSRTW